MNYDAYILERKPTLLLIENQKNLYLFTDIKADRILTQYADAILACIY